MMEAVGSSVVLALWLAASPLPASANDWNAARVAAPGAPRRSAATAVDACRERRPCRRAGRGTSSAPQAQPSVRSPSARRLRSAPGRHGQGEEAGRGPGRRPFAGSRWPDPQRSSQPPDRARRGRRLCSAAGPARRRRLGGGARTRPASCGGGPSNTFRHAGLDVEGGSVTGAGRQRSDGGQDLRQPGDQTDAVRRTRRKSALGRAHPPLVGAPRPFPRSPQVPGGKPRVRRAGSAAGRRLWPFSCLVVYPRRAGTLDRRKRADEQSGPRLPEACAALLAQPAKVAAR